MVLLYFTDLIAALNTVNQLKFEGYMKVDLVSLEN